MILIGLFHSLDFLPVAFSILGPKTYSNLRSPEQQQEGDKDNKDAEKKDHDIEMHDVAKPIKEERRAETTNLMNEMLVVAL